VGVAGDGGDSTAAARVALVDNEVGNGVSSPACRLMKSRTSLSMIVVRTYVPKRTGLSVVQISQLYDSRPDHSELAEWLCWYNSMLPPGWHDLPFSSLLRMFTSTTEVYRCAGPATWCHSFTQAGLTARTHVALPQHTA